MNSRTERQTLCAILLPFGTIFSMTFSHRRPLWQTIVFLTLISNLTFACAPFSEPEPAAAASILLSPTPFQPQAGAPDSPFAAPLSAQPEPTFTPYPAPLIPPSFMPTPAQVFPSSGSQGQSLLPTLNNPLTGLPASDPALLNRRPMAIKISNSPDFVRPQSGLTLADVVYEYYIEWGDTRFIAIFYGNDARMAGPVRSGRYFDEHITRMYHAYYVFKGADPREFSYFKQTDLANFLVDLMWLEFPCSPYEVGKGSAEVYHRIFFNTLKFTDCLQRKGLD